VDGNLKAVVDPARCCGYTLCNQECPEVFELDENGFAVVAMTVIPPELAAKARAAAAACPEDAIVLSNGS
jgi:ferredoxin